MKDTIDELRILIDRDAILLESTLSLIVSNMTIAELRNYNKLIDKLEVYLEKNSLKLEELKANSVLEDF